MAEQHDANWWLDRAIERAEEGLRDLQYARLASGPTRSQLKEARDQLFAASEHLLDAGFALGVGDLRR